MNNKKIKFNKEEMKKLCYSVIDNETIKGTPLINNDGSLVSKEQCYKDNLNLFETNENFIKDAYSLMNLSKKTKNKYNMSFEEFKAEYQSYYDNMAEQSLSYKHNGQSPISIPNGDELLKNDWLKLQAVKRGNKQ